MAKKTKGRKPSRKDKNSKVKKLIKLSKGRKGGAKMMNIYVTKKGGKKEAFNNLKLLNSVKQAAKDAKLSSNEAEKLAKEVCDVIVAEICDKGSITSSELRKITLSKVDKRSKEAGNAWRKYEKEHKK